MHRNSSRPFAPRLVTYALAPAVALLVLAACGGASEPASSSGARAETSGGTRAETSDASESGESSEAASLYLVDLLALRPGVEASQAEEYFSRVTPIIARHGLESVHRFQVRAKMAGPVEPQLVNLWSMRSMRTMADIQGDPDYRANIELRDATFDMPNAQMFVVEALESPTGTDAPLLFIDLLDLQPDVEPAQASEYFSRITPVVENHGLVPVGRFRVRQRLAGTIEPELVNLWTMRGPDTMPAIQGDAAYQENVALRNSTFVMSSAVMLMLAPADS